MSQLAPSRAIGFDQLVEHQMQRGIVLDGQLSVRLHRPEEVGAYRLVREVGRGGMGVVYLAERSDGGFEQRVALKLVKRGLDTDAIVARFRAPEPKHGPTAASGPA